MLLKKFSMGINSFFDEVVMKYVGYIFHNNLIKKTSRIDFSCI